jgi:nitrate/TMAO reductase-like tetraheme cytochrome c subunit
MIRFSILILFLLLLSCSKPQVRKDVPVTLIFSCDTQGRLEPCGCFSGQYGGLSRIYTKVESFKKGLVLKVDAGDAISGKKDYDLILYKYVQEAFKKMDYHAMNIGAREAALSLEQLNSISLDKGPPLISANLFNKNTGKPLLKQFVIVNEHGLKVLITGIVDPELLGEQVGNGLELRDVEASLTELLKNNKADMHVLLAFCTPEKMKKLASKFFEFDLILGGKVTQPSPQLIKENQSVILYTTNQAKNIGYVEGILKSNGLLDEVSYDIELLKETVPENKSILQLAIDYRKEIRKTKLNSDTVDSNSENLIPGVTPQAAYVGSASCSSCHSTSHKQWQATSHSKAFAALKQRDSDADPKCIQCHTVGFGEPSGYLRNLKDKHLTNVGCESCHGPGSEHIRQRASGQKVLFNYRPLGEGDCRKCHYGEFSRPFNWDSMWPQIKHGKEKK